MDSAKFTFGAFGVGALVVLIFAIGYVTGHPTKPTITVPYPNGTVEEIIIRGDAWAVFVGGHDGVLDILHFYAITSCKEKRIYVHGSLTLGNQRNTLLHELLHAGACGTDGQVNNLYYNSETENGHEGIYKISEYVTILLHDNPELAHYLIGQ